jgi:adenylate cyclase
MKLPLRITITTAFTVLTAATVLLVAGLNYAGNHAAIMESAREDISRSTANAEQEVRNLVGRAFAAADTISGLPRDLFDIRAPDGLLSTLTVALRTSPEIYGVFVGFPDGGFVQAINLVAPDDTRRIVAGMPEDAATAWRIIGPVVNGSARTENWRFFALDSSEIYASVEMTEKPSDYDPRTRPWFIDAQDVDDTVVSQAYVFASSQRPGVTIARPLLNLPEATVGVDLPLDDLGALTRRLQPGENGILAILDSDGDIVGYPDATKILKTDTTGKQFRLVSASELDDPRLHGVVKSELANQQAHFDFIANGNQYIGYASPIGSTDLATWRIVGVAAIDDFTHDLLATLHRSLIVAGAVLVIAMLGVAMMAGWITLPVIRLRQMADQITNLNLADIKTFDSPFEEIKRLQNSMDHMRGALDTFLRFVPRDVVRELIASGRSAVIGGTQREVTLLFTDVEDFTSMAEKMTPEQIMSQASEYFEVMSLGIQSNRGTIDKFIGDAIMAIWNAPEEDPFHVDNACRGVLAAYQISNDLNAEFEARGMKPMRTRFGLHTSDVLVGNVGARDRMQYTCLGSGVNLAARIEGLNKFYGTQILASDTVRRNASSDYLFRRVDIVEAKGTTVPLTIYELMGERGEDSTFFVGNDKLRLASRYEQAFDFYLHGDFSDALFILDQLAEIDPDDAVVAQLRVKCRTFDETPPPPEWNGATVLDKK